MRHPIVFSATMVNLLKPGWEDLAQLPEVGQPPQLTRRRR